jgi:hypothetical protein
MSDSNPLLHFAVTRQFSRFRREADIAEADLRVRAQDVGASCQKSSPMGKAAKIY